jgi:hypothetical protein
MKEINAAIKVLADRQATKPHVNNERATLRLQQALALVEERDRDEAKVAKAAAAKAEKPDA